MPNRVILGLAAALVALTAAGLIARARRPSPVPFSECVLEEMRGQGPQAMLVYAWNVCSHRTGKSISDGLSETGL
jgi:hypothetical protein